MSRVASARTVTVMTWTPALPPIAATIGIRTASATVCWIVSWNCEMTVAAIMVLISVTTSQRTRCQAMMCGGAWKSVSEAPTIFIRSSSASSSITRTTSSTVTTPISRPASSTTGADTSAYCRNR